MNFIKPKDKQYSKYVANYDAKHYEIFTKNCQVGDAIQCPNDESLFIIREGSGIMIVNTKQRINLKKLD